jgi:hypothetical protein
MISKGAFVWYYFKVNFVKTRAQYKIIWCKTGRQSFILYSLKTSKGIFACFKIYSFVHDLLPLTWEKVNSFYILFTLLGQINVFLEAKISDILPVRLTCPRYTVIDHISDTGPNFGQNGKFCAVLSHRRKEPPSWKLELAKNS